MEGPSPRQTRRICTGQGRLKRPGRRVEHHTRLWEVQEIPGRRIVGLEQRFLGGEGQLAPVQPAPVRHLDPAILRQFLRQAHPRRQPLRQRLRRLQIEPQAGIALRLPHNSRRPRRLVRNLGEFTNTTFHIDTEMMPIVEGTDPCHPFFRQGYGKRDCATIRRFKAEGRLVEHANVSVPWQGIELVHIGGHCRGQMAIRVNTKRGPIVLASDAAHLYQEWEEEKPFGVFYDMRAMLEGYQTLTRLSGGKRTEMIAGHDSAVMSMFPAPAEELKGQAVSLHEAPIG